MNNEMNKDEHIALTLVAALIQSGNDDLQTPRLEKAYAAYKELHHLIADTPESRARRGFAR